jgi:hypothetical protein
MRERRESVRHPLCNCAVVLQGAGPPFVDSLHSPETFTGDVLDMLAGR